MIIYRCGDLFRIRSGRSHPVRFRTKQKPFYYTLSYVASTKWSHSLAWFERPADNRKVLCSNHNGTTTLVPSITYQLKRQQSIVFNEFVNYIPGKSSYDMISGIREFYRSIDTTGTGEQSNSLYFETEEEEENPLE